MIYSFNRCFYPKATSRSAVKCSIAGPNPSPTCPLMFDGLHLLLGEAPVGRQLLPGPWLEEPVRQAPGGGAHVLGLGAVVQFKRQRGLAVKALVVELRVGLKGVIESCHFAEKGHRPRRPGGGCETWSGRPTRARCSSNTTAACSARRMRLNKLTLKLAVKIFRSISHFSPPPPPLSTGVKSVRWVSCFVCTYLYRIYIIVYLRCSQLLKKPKVHHSHKTKNLLPRSFQFLFFFFFKKKNLNFCLPFVVCVFVE